MKNLVLVAIICLLFFGSCTKKNDVTPAEPDRTAIIEGDYRMLYIKDATGTIDLTDDKDGFKGVVSFKRIDTKTVQVMVKAFHNNVSIRETSNTIYLGALPGSGAGVTMYATPDLSSQGNVGSGTKDNVTLKADDVEIKAVR